MIRGDSMVQHDTLARWVWVWVGRGDGGCVFVIVCMLFIFGAHL